MLQECDSERSLSYNIVSSVNLYCLSFHVISLFMLEVINARENSYLRYRFVLLLHMQQLCIFFQLLLCAHTVKF